MKVLVIKSSITGEYSHTNKKIDEIVEKYKNEGHEVVIKDVAVNPVPVFDSNLLAGFRGDEQYAQQVNIHNELVEEALTVDEFVVGAPMYNFSVPVQLKSYFDAISRAGKTFKYTENGPIGLLPAKKVTVVSARGGYYTENGFDNMEIYLKSVFTFLGVKEHNFVLIEGTAMGADNIKVFQK